MPTLDDVKDVIDKMILQILINKMYVLKNDFTLLLSDKDKVQKPTQILIQIRLYEIQDQLDLLQKEANVILKKYEQPDKKEDKKDDIKKYNKN